MTYNMFFSGVNPESNDTCINYQIQITKTGATGTTREIELAGGTPVELTYDVSNTPFDPIRYSRLNIRVVCDDYLEDILPTTPFETEVVLKDLSHNKTVFVGYLAPFNLDAGYRECYETFDLQANDCLMVLKYLPFETKVSGTTDIVDFRDILAQICNRTGLLKGFYWGRTKKRGTTFVRPEYLGISEKNFFYDDVTETLKLDEVLEHMCQYVGYTAVQEGEYLYLFDYQAMKGSATQEGMLRYLKNSYYAASSTVYNIGSTITMSQSYVVGSSPTITIEPIKNKIEVRDNYYNIEYLIPEIFDDEYLTNRLSPTGNSYNFNYSVEVSRPVGATERGSWRNGIWTSWEKVGDTAYTFSHRVYDHKYYESVYNNSSTDTANTNYKTAVGGTIVEHGCVKNEREDEFGNMQISSSVDYKRYLMISQQNQGVGKNGDNLIWNILYPNTPPQDYTVFRLKSGYKAGFVAAENSYLVLNGSIMFEKYIERPYINPEWSTKPPRYSVLPLTPGGMMSFGYMAFKLGIGDKWWNGTGWTTTERGFWVAPEKTQKTNPAYNISSNILNNVHWDEYLGCDGYKIPLYYEENGVPKSIDTTQEIHFAVLLPSIQFINGNTKEYNAFAWLGDLSVKMYRAGESEMDNGKENDFIITNIINSGSVMEMNTIELKITTASDKSKPSWSDCIYMNATTKTLLTGLQEPAITAKTQTCEENIVQKYVEQYSTQTKKISIVVPSNISQFTKFENLDVDNPNDDYVILGTTIDYADGSQRITAIKKN